MKRYKMEWMKLLKPHKYNVEEKLQALVYILKKGKDINFYYGKGDRHGVHQFCFNYSFNNEPNKYMPINHNNITDFIDLCLFRFFHRSSYYEPIEKFKSDKEIFGKYKMLPDNRTFELQKKIFKLNKFEDKVLNFNPHAGSGLDEDSGKCLIIGKPLFLIGGLGFAFKFYYRFENTPEGSYWKYWLYPEKTESMNDFMDRVLLFLEESTKWLH